MEDEEDFGTHVIRDHDLDCEIDWDDYIESQILDQKFRQVTTSSLRKRKIIEDDEE